MSHGIKVQKTIFLKSRRKGTGLFRLAAVNQKANKAGINLVLSKAVPLSMLAEKAHKLLGN
jgi:hypothetical protein